LLLLGETGTGKETIARACHSVSGRGSKPFELVSVTGRSPAETELQLFGDGGQQPGLLQDPEVGCVLLKEIGELSFELQSRLMAWLSENVEKSMHHRTDESACVPRLMMTTQKDLGQLVIDGQFREDLFYRISAFTLMVPPLRDRKQDIIALAEYFLKQQAIMLGNRPPKLAKSCVEFLQGYPWPGNIRQLESAICRATLTVNGREIHKDNIQLPNCIGSFNFSSTEFEGTLDEAVRKFEKSLLLQLYPSFPSTRQLAKKLGLSHTAIANKLREYGINRKSIKI